MTYCSVGVYFPRRNVCTDGMVPVIQDPSEAKIQHDVVHADIAVQDFAFVVGDLDNYVSPISKKQDELMWITHLLRCSVSPVATAYCSVAYAEG